MHLEGLRDEGHLLLRGVLSAREAEDVVRSLAPALEAAGHAAGIRGGRRPYAARNLLDVLPAAWALASHPLVRDAVCAVLGPGAGLVRALLMDKPPGRSWSLAWHRDRTVAVMSRALLPAGFTARSEKAGVTHLLAPPATLERMLTARIHLDEVTIDNGPLLVVPGSHAVEVPLPDARAVTVLARAGDVLLMRPLLLHRSVGASPGTRRHRRILHFEYAAAEALPAPLRWHTFRPLVPA